MRIDAAKTLAWIAVLTPLIYEIALLSVGDPGPDPAKQAVHFTGQTAIWILLVALLATPLRVYAGIRWLVRVRRITGVAAFCYGVVHLAAYLVFILGLDVSYLAEELAERPYITAGMAALLLMLPLAITSTDGFVRRLKHRWRKLHRLVYPAAVLAVVHVWWQARSDIGFALLLATLLALLLLLRWGRVERLLKRAV